MENRPKSFKDKLKDLIEEARLLVNNTPSEEIQEEGIILIPPHMIMTIVCKSEEEFGERMLRRIRLDGNLIVPQYLDKFDFDELEKKKGEYAIQGIELRIPALVAPLNPLMEDRNFKSYIITFTHDNKLFMHPNDADSFLV